MALELPQAGKEAKPTVSQVHPAGKEVQTMGLKPASAASRVDNGAQLRTYRLALACTGEYASYHGGNVGSVLAAMNTSMVRVNGIFERDACLTMEIVANNDQLIFLNGATDPYTNKWGRHARTEHQHVQQRDWFENYDIGHVFSTGGASRTCNRHVAATRQAE